MQCHQKRVSIIIMLIKLLIGLCKVYTHMHMEINKNNNLLT